MNAALEELSKPHPARFSVPDFIRMCEAGVFDQYAKSELIEGEVWVMNAIHSQHGRAQFELGVSLRIALNQVNSDLRVYTAISVEMPDSLPEPDLVVAPSHSGMMPLRKVALVCEISDTTLETDLGRKAALYAAAGVPEYWVADLANNVLHCHSDPEAEGYGCIIKTPFGEWVQAKTVANLTVSTADLLD